MLYITKYAEQQDRDVMKMRNNVDTLIDIATSFSNPDSFFSQMKEIGTSKGSKNGVKVLTIHSSKGLEFKYVFLPFWNQGVVPLTGPVPLEKI